MLLNILLKLFSPVVGPPCPEGFGRWDHLLWSRVFPLAKTGVLLQTFLRHQLEELGLFALIFQECRIHTAKIRGDAGSLYNSANGHEETLGLITQAQTCPTQVFSPYPRKCSWTVSELRCLLKAARVHGQDSQN